MAKFTFFDSFLQNSDSEGKDEKLTDLKITTNKPSEIKLTRATLSDDKGNIWYLKLNEQTNEWEEWDDDE